MNKLLTEKEKRDRIANVIRGGYTDRIRWQVGPEIEHFVFDRKSGKRIFYPGENGVEGILQAFSRRHPDPSEDDRGNPGACSSGGIIRQ